MSNSFFGEVYFRVSKHLGWLPSEVIKKKFNPDIKFLIFKYSQEIRNEIKQNEELKEKFPELTNQLIESVKSEEKTSVQEEIKNAVLSERKRIEEIEQIENSIADKELLNKAKFSAEETMNAKELAFEAMKAQGVKNTEYLNNLDKDNADSKVNDVKTEAPKVETINEKDAAVESMTKIFQSIKK